MTNSPMPIDLLADGSISPQAKVLWALVNEMNARGEWPDLDWLADCIGEGDVDDPIQELKQHGWLSNASSSGTRLVAQVKWP